VLSIGPLGSTLYTHYTYTISVPRKLLACLLSLSIIGLPLSVQGAIKGIRFRPQPLNSTQANGLSQLIAPISQASNISGGTTNLSISPEQEAEITIDENFITAEPKPTSILENSWSKLETTVAGNHTQDPLFPGTVPNLSAISKTPPETLFDGQDRQETNAVNLGDYSANQNLLAPHASIHLHQHPPPCRTLRSEPSRPQPFTCWA